jgi:predicted nucleic acid-binding protein
MALVLDTGVIYAALDRGDPAHEPCISLIQGTREQPIIPDPVLVELDYWLGQAGSLDIWLQFGQDVAAGAYALWPMDSSLLNEVAALQHRFHDQPIGFVDAAVFSTCVALGEDKVATLDRRHFSVLRTQEGGALRILPE